MGSRDTAIEDAQLKIKQARALADVLMAISIPGMVRPGIVMDDTAHHLASVHFDLLSDALDYLATEDAGEAAHG